MHQHALRRYWITTAILFSIALVIKLFSLSHTWVEQWYSTGIYIFISSILRIFTGWVPFSIGDVLYTVAGIWIIVKVVKSLAALFRRRVTKRSFVRGVLKTINFLLLI